MQEFIKGKIKPDSSHTTQSEVSQANKSNSQAIMGGDFRVKELNLIPTKPLTFSDEAKEVFSAGLALFKYYHSQAFGKNAIFHNGEFAYLNAYNPNASLYDIKAYFQGFNEKGKMNPPQKAQDEHYKDLIGNLNFALNILAQKLKPKIYEYGFLRE